MNVQNINTPTYTIAIDATNKSATFTTACVEGQAAICYNASDKAVFVVSGASQPTAVFPTSATVPVGGKVIPPGAVMTYDLNQGDKYISAIQAVAGTGSLYISIGEGV